MALAGDQEGAGGVFRRKTVDVGNRVGVARDVGVVVLGLARHEEVAVVVRGDGGIGLIVDGGESGDEGRLSPGQA